MTHPLGYLVIPATWLATLLLTQPLAALLRSGGAVRRSYRGSLVPTGGGVVFPLVLLPALVLASRVGVVERNDASTYAVILLGGWGAGAVDDWLGRGGPRGWAGHLGGLRRGQITTGQVKILTGLTLGLWAAGWMGRTGTELIVDVALFPLAMNSVNLLDLRPGRALVYFVAALGLTYPLRAGFTAEPVLIMTAAAALGFLPWDRTAKLMLGDSGANALGAVLGLGLVAAEPAGLRVGMVIVLAAVQLIGELTPISRALDMIWDSGGMRSKKRE